MEKTTVYTSEDGKEIPVIIIDDNIFISNFNLILLFGGEGLEKEMSNWKESIAYGTKIDHVRAVRFKVWCNIRCGDFIRSQV